MRTCNDAGGRLERGRGRTNGEAHVDVVRLQVVALLHGLHDHVEPGHQLRQHLAPPQVLPQRLQVLLRLRVHQRHLVACAARDTPSALPPRTSAPTPS